MSLQLTLPYPQTAPPKRGGAVLLHSRRATFVVHLVRMRRARRYVLRVRPDGSLRVTVPRGGSRAEALRFAERHLAWAVRERARLLARPAMPLAWTTGTAILVDGVPVTVARESGGNRDVVSAGRITVVADDAVTNVRPVLEQALRNVARAELPPRLLALATRHGLRVLRVSVRGQRSRWGSCSPRGHITLNFRLVQMPPDVRDYILLHELMHLREANHSRRFWRLVAAVCPEYRAAERWLKTMGTSLF